MAWVADGDPLKIEGFKKMSLIEYFLLLDKKIGDVRKANAEIQRKTK